MDVVIPEDFMNSGKVRYKSLLRNLGKHNTESLTSNAKSFRVKSCTEYRIISSQNFRTTYSEKTFPCMYDLHIKLQQNKKAYRMYTLVLITKTLNF